MSSPRTTPTTRQKLLEAATQVFAHAGFAGARVDEIARRARANKAMIYYHFGTKRDLYQAVLTRLFAGLRSEMDRVARAEADPLHRLISFYARLAAGFQAQPALPHIVLREILSGGRHMHAETARVLFGGLLDFIRQTLDAGVRAGRMRPADPLLVHLGMIGPIALYFVSEPFRLRLMPAVAPGASPPTPEALLRHLEILLTRGLRPDADPTRS